jgi:zinc protease
MAIQNIHVYKILILKYLQMKPLKNIVLIVFLILSQLSLFSQSFNANDTIPLDTLIKKGKLENGLTYYIRYNSKPEKRVELRLAVNAGSVLEDSDQLGLAHFTEHMAFNGTKNFAKNDLVKYLQSVGVRFGADLNAYTSFDETVYMLFLPTDNQETLEKGFMVLSDWGHNLTYDSTEIEKERGVIVEEWRLGQGAEQRMQDKYLPMIFQNSQYAVRLPIGTKQSLDNFKQASLKRFYSDWYRPNQMAVVVVGDLSVNEAEQLIKKYFSIMPTADKVRQRTEYKVPEQPGTLVSVCTDKETSMTRIMMFYKTEHANTYTNIEYRNYYLQQIYFYMLNQRLSELTRSENPPFINAYSYFGGIGGRSLDSYISMALVSDTGVVKGLKAILEENEKVKRFGFSESELERTKKELLTNYETAYQERDKTESENFANEYVRNFLEKEPAPGIAYEYKLFEHLAPQITLDEVNQLAKKWITDNNRVLVVTAPEKEGVVIPKENELRNVLAEIDKSDLKAYEDKLSGSELMKEKPTAGKIAKREELKKIGVTHLTLTNGVQVLLKPTDFKNDEIQMSAISAGGQCLYPNEDHYSATYTTNIIRECGVNGYSLNDLQKLLAGKSVFVNSFVSTYTEGFRGTSTPKDLETLFQLTYLYATSPGTDTMAFHSFISRNKSYIENLKSNPQVYYSDQLSLTLNQGHPRGNRVPKIEDLDKINLNRVFEIYKNRFADFSDFTFVFTGSFKLDSIIPLIETYLGSLPSINRKESFKDLGIRAPKGSVLNNVYKGTDPKSLVTMVYTDSVKYDKKDDYLLESLADLMNIKLIEILREEKSGVYGVRANASMSRVPFGSYTITIRFPCSPYNVDSLVKAAEGIITDIQQNGATAEYLNKVKEAQIREYEVSIKTNEYWLSYLENSWFNHDNMTSILDAKKDINKLRSKDLQAVAKKYFKKDYIKVVLYPESMGK